jgi:ADP-ribose pyrophosphatase YjhB (NUDIX family)
VGFKDQLLDQTAAVWRRLPAELRYKVLGATQPKFLVGVVGIIRDDSGRILVLDHRFRVPWSWGLPGGFLERGETMVAGLERELREETRLEVRVSADIIDIEHEPDLGFLSFCLGGQLVGGSLDLSDEILEARFVEPDHLPEDIYPYHRALVQRAMRPKPRS